ncbi:hypothetical protein VC184_09775 [Microbacterium plantarum]|nr:hypothetical protein [Microbacterium plantarum]WRK19091.1 hypothetical protein VC184_09775 [Microbacterium plantarum]
MPVSAKPIVVARSPAEIPVVTPRAGVPSIDTVKAVPMWSSLCGTMGGKLELRGASGREREAHQSSSVRDHEVDDARVGMVCGRDEIPLVLTILVVDDHHDLAACDGGDGFRSGIHNGVRGDVVELNGHGVPPHTWAAVLGRSY